jgi:hypothetical protein
VEQLHDVLFAPELVVDTVWAEHRAEENPPGSLRWFLDEHELSSKGDSRTTGLSK